MPTGWWPATNARLVAMSKCWCSTYLEVLRTKPGALPGATALAQAKASGAFTATHQRYWDAARRARGDAAGTRALIEILLAHRTLPRHALEAAMRTAIDTSLLDPQVVIIDARRHTITSDRGQPVGRDRDRGTPVLSGVPCRVAGRRSRRPR